MQILSSEQKDGGVGAENGEVQDVRSMGTTVRRGLRMGQTCFGEVVILVMSELAPQNEDPN